jgi:hypothetical protein
VVVCGHEPHCQGVSMLPAAMMPILIAVLMGAAAVIGEASEGAEEQQPPG